MRHPISTFPRFMYLNAYAFLLLLVGIGIMLLPGYRISWWLLLPQAIVAIPCLKGAHGIFASWKDKKRKYDLLIQRNAEQFRPDTFTEFMHAPCGRLLAKIVLEDMHCPERYRELKHLRQPFIKQLRKNCRPRKHTVYVNPNI